MKAPAERCRLGPKDDNEAWIKYLLMLACTLRSVEGSMEWLFDNFNCENSKWDWWALASGLFQCKLFSHFIRSTYNS